MIKYNRYPPPYSHSVIKQSKTGGAKTNSSETTFVYYNTDASRRDNSKCSKDNINNFIYYCHKFAVQDTADRSMGMPSLSILIKIMDGCMGTRLHGNKATTKTAEGEGG